MGLDAVQLCQPQAASVKNYQKLAAAGAKSTQQQLVLVHNRCEIGTNHHFESVTQTHTLHRAHWQASWQAWTPAMMNEPEGKMQRRSLAWSCERRRAFPVEPILDV